MYIHEVQYQQTKPSNRQERYLQMESWETYKRCLLGIYRTHPALKLPDEFRSTMIEDEKSLSGRWRHKIFGDDLIHYAYIVEKSDIPNGVYIIEVNIEK